MSKDADFKEVPIKELESKKTISVIKESKTAKRHVIPLNRMDAFKNEYSKNNTLKTRNLINDKEVIESIAIYSEEYIPEHFDKSKEYIKYVLTINSSNYDIIPINKESDGIKIIRSSTHGYVEDSSLYINEDIVTAYLNITIEAPNKSETPFINNIKIIKK